MIVLYHMKPPVTPFTLSLIPEQLQNMFFLGVDLFFVVSGLIMAETTRQLNPGLRTASRFLWNRFSRIYSGWWPFFLVYLAGFLYFNRLRPEIDLLGSLFLWPQNLTKYLLPITWTLSFELYFYCGLAAMIFWSRQRAPHVLIVIGGIVAFLNLYFLLSGLYLPANEERAKEYLFVPFFASPLILEFIGGFLLGEWLHRRPQRNVWPWAVGAALLFTVAFYYQNYVPLNKSGMAGFFHVVERTVLLGGFSICVAAILVIIEQDHDFAPFKLFQRLGDASYSIYLSYIFVLSLSTILFTRPPPSLRLPFNL